MAKNSSTVHKGQVKLREKKLANGNSSLYLDILHDGKRHKEYLKLYLVAARTAAEREQNRQILSVANAMRSRRELEIINGEYNIAMPKKAEVYFLDYYRKLCEDRHKKPDTHGNWGNWHSCLKHLELYCTEKTTLSDITPVKRHLYYSYSFHLVNKVASITKKP